MFTGNLPISQIPQSQNTGKIHNPTTQGDPHNRTRPDPWMDPTRIRLWTRNNGKVNKLVSK